MQKIGANVYVEVGFRGCNTGFVTTKDGVVMIDSPQFPADAVRWRDEIAKHSEVRYLINTEPHGDHFSGNGFFSGTVVGHEGTRAAVLATPVEQIKDRLAQDPRSAGLLDGFKLKPPAITLSQKMSLYVGDHTFHLINFPGHTAFQVAVYIPEEGVVFTSDNVFGRVQAWLHQCLPFEWLESLKRMQELGAETFVPGHGRVCDRSCLTEMSAFIQAWIDRVRDAIKQGMTSEEAQEKVSLLDRYPMEAGSEAMAQQVQRWNVARLYEVLQKH